MDDVTRLPEDFDGRVRLFPLPGLVMFPHAMQPLHLFEPRYVEMLHDAMATDQLISMATLLDPHSSSNSIGKPAISSTVCIGRIVSHAELEGDRHNILLVGAKRATIQTELETGRAFRSAKVEVIEDVYTPGAAAQRDELKRQLLVAFGEIIPPTAGAQKNLHDLMAGQMGIGPITDIISYTLPFEAEDKLRLLAIGDVDRRANELIELIRSGQIELESVSVSEQEIDLAAEHSSHPKDQFPPPFSVN